MTELEAFDAALDTHNRFCAYDVNRQDFKAGWEAAMDYLKDRMLIICPDCKEAGCDKDED
jgi:hypothetical protein